MLKFACNDALNNNKYKHLAKLQHISSLMERLRQNQSCINAVSVETNLSNNFNIKIKN